jgi:hypothetical protein
MDSKVKVLHSVLHCDSMMEGVEGSLKTNLSRELVTDLVQLTQDLNWNLVPQEMNLVLPMETQDLNWNLVLPMETQDLNWNLIPQEMNLVLPMETQDLNWNLVPQEMNLMETHENLVNYLMGIQS